MVVGLVEVVCAVFLVTHIQNLLHGEQVKVLHELLFDVIKLKCTCELALLEVREELFEHLVLFHRCLVTPLCILRHIAESFCHRLRIGHDELEINDLYVGKRVNRTLNVNDVGVIKYAHHFCNHVGLANVCEKLVAEPFTGGSTAHEPRDVHKFNDRGERFF